MDKAYFHKRKEEKNNKFFIVIKIFCFYRKLSGKTYFLILKDFEDFIKIYVKEFWRQKEREKIWNYLSIYFFLLSSRLRCLLRQLQRGEISAELLQKNLHYAARVLEAVFIDETKWVIFLIYFMLKRKNKKIFNYLYYYFQLLFFPYSVSNFSKMHQKKRKENEIYTETSNMLIFW